MSADTSKSFSQLHAEYNGLLDNEKLPPELRSEELLLKLERLRRDGQRATRRGKEMNAGKHVSSFGGARPCTAIQAATSALARNRASSSWDVFRQLKPGFAARPGSFKSIIEASKLSDRTISRETKVQAKLVAERVDAYAGNETSVAIAKSVSDSISHASLQQFRTLPLSSCHQLIDASKLDTARCEDSLAWVAHNPSLSNVGIALEKRFREAHQLLTHETSGHDPAIADEPAIPPAAAGTKFEVRCNFYGRCLCKGAGLVLWRFRNSYLQCEKKMFPHTSALREQLSDGRFFVKLIGKSSPFSALGPQEPLHLCQVIIFHIAAHYKSPFRPTFHLMQLAPESPDLDGQQILLKARILNKIDRATFVFNGAP